MKKICNLCIGKDICGATPNGDVCKNYFTPNYNLNVYSVSIVDNSYTNEATKLSWYKYQPSTSSITIARKDGDFDLYINGQKVAILFVNQIDQINYLKNKGIL